MTDLVCKVCGGRIEPGTFLPYRHVDRLPRGQHHYVIPRKVLPLTR